MTEPTNLQTYSTKFGIADYYRMFKSVGFGYAWGHFVNNHLWDIINGTDTHKRLLKEDFTTSEQSLSNFEFGVGYGPSWNIEVKKPFKIVNNLINNMEDYSFTDAGCGKGKVLILWQQLLQKNNIKQKIVGIEYSKILVDIARINYKKVLNDTVDIENADITTMSYNFTNFSTNKGL